MLKPILLYPLGQLPVLNYQRPLITMNLLSFYISIYLIFLLLVKVIQIFISYFINNFTYSTDLLNLEVESLYYLIILLNSCVYLTVESISSMNFSKISISNCPGLGRSTYCFYYYFSY